MQVKDDSPALDATDAGHRSVGLVVKISLTIIFVITFSVVTTALLTFFNLSRSYSEINQSRYLVLANNLRNDLQFSINVGISLNELTNAQALVESTARRYEDVRLLRIVDVKQSILFDANEKLIGSDVSYQDAQRTSLQKEKAMSLQTKALDLLVMDVMDQFGGKAGELHIGYDRNMTDSYLYESARYLLQHAGLSISFVGVLVLIIVYLMTWKFRWRLGRMQLALDGLMHDSSHDPHEVVTEGNLEENYHAFHEKTQELLYSFDATHQKLEQLERGDVNG